jgi:DNA-binding GntR family transcriptional regulator
MIPVATPLKPLDRAFSRDSMARRVADALRTDIPNGRYRLDQKLRELELASQFTVSNSVIREALHILQGEGIVVTEPFRGRRVFNISEAEYRDLVIARASLESVAAGLAAKRLDVESKRSISDATARFLTAQPASYADLAVLDFDFHKAVWRAAKSEWLFKHLSQLVFPLFSLNTLQYIYPNSDFEEILQMSLGYEMTDEPPGHRWVAKCILSGDVERARKSMILHVTADRSFEDLRREFF